MRDKLKTTENLVKIELRINVLRQELRHSLIVTLTKDFINTLFKHYTSHRHIA